MEYFLQYTQSRLKQFPLHSLEVQTNSGKVRGLIQSSTLPEVKVQKFLNIPYPEAPVGQLRFKKPQPRKPWNGKPAIYAIYHFYKKHFIILMAGKTNRIIILNFLGGSGKIFVSLSQTP